MSKNFFIFGATGDLVRKKLIPGLEKFSKKNEVNIYALGRKFLSKKDYINLIDKDYNKEFLSKITYIKVDFESEQICLDCLNFMNKESENYFYISLPPESYKQTLIYILDLKKKGYNVKILLEKPFGASLSEANDLKKIAENLDLVIVDHYLFKEKVYDLAEKSFKKLIIASLEDIDIANREFYDKVGALRDMVQSHLLNILFRIYPEIKKNIEKIKVLEYKRGQYKGYKEQIKKESNTETYVKVVLEYNGKIIELVTGKALKEKKSFIKIDSEIMNLEEKDNAYYKVLEDFFNGKRERFPSILDSIIAWKIVDKIENIESGLFLYDKGSDI